MNGLTNPTASSRPFRRYVVCVWLLIGLLAPITSGQVPVAVAQEPDPQSPIVVSPLEGRQPPLPAWEAGVQPANLSPALSVRGPLSPRGTITGTVSPPSYKPGVVKQFEETSYYIKDIEFITTTVGWAVGYPHWDQATRTYTGTIV